MSKFKRLKKIPLWRLIGPAVVVAAIYLAGPAKVWAVLSNTDLKFVVTAAALAIPLVIIKVIRWRILLHNYDIELAFRNSTSMYAIGMVLSAVTPGRVGDLVKIVLLIKKGCSAAKAIASNILDRLFDVVFVFYRELRRDVVFFQELCVTVEYRQQYFPDSFGSRSCCGA
jgi:uncharacterized protein (TIRG00374 family)